MARTIFVTGTDTGVGKTVFAASLLYHLRSQGRRALGMKPFCSGGREDVRLLQEMQPGELSDGEVNPFYYKDAVAPLVAQRQRRGLKVTLRQAVKAITAVGRRCDVLVIEGSGGLLVPLGEDFMVADLIRALRCEVVIVARNKLGTINHTLLTVEAVKRLRPKGLKVVLMKGGRGDASTKTNPEILRELLAPIVMVEYPFLGEKAASLGVFEGHRRIFKKVLAEVFK